MLLLVGALSAGEPSPVLAGNGRHVFTFRDACGKAVAALLHDGYQPRRATVASVAITSTRSRIPGTRLSLLPVHDTRYLYRLSAYALAGSGVLLAAALFLFVRRKVRKVLMSSRRFEESEQRYSLVFENGNDGIAIVKNGLIGYSNQRLSHLTGLSKNELAGKHFSQLIAPSSQSRFIDEYYARIRLRSVADIYETEIVSREADDLAVELRIFSFEDGDGRRELFLVRDIAERKKLAEERTRFSLFIDRNPNPVIEVRLDGGINYANKSAQRLFPLLTSEGAGSGFLSDFYRTAGILKNGEKESCTRELSLDGRWYQQQFYYCKETGRVLVYGFDITDRKRAELSLLRSEERYRTLFETMDQGILIHASDGKVLSANPAAERILGMPVSGMIYKNCGDVFRDSIRDDGTPFSGDACPSMMALRSGREVKDVLMGVLNAASGRRRWINVNVLPQFLPDEKGPCQAYTLFNDVTEKRATEKELRDSETRYRGLFESSRDGIFIVDWQNADIIDANPGLCVMLGYSRQELCGSKFWEVPSFKRIVAHRGAFIEMRLGEYTHYDSITVLHREGQLLDVEFISSVYNVGTRKVIQCSIRNISGRKKADKQIKYLNFHDRVTGLYNWTYFEEELRRIDTEREVPISCIVGGIGNLKLVNDAFGRQAGDRLLVRVAGILRCCCRNEDIVARRSGDEFIILLPRTDETTARDIARRIGDECRATKLLPMSPAVALGIATKDKATIDSSEILREADDRLYRDKLLQSRNGHHAIIASLLRTLRERGHEPFQHTQRLKRCAAELGRLVGISDSQMDELSLLAVLHDIGKITVPEEILSKNSILTPKEWKIMLKHPVAGYRIVQSFGTLAPIADAVLSHHERWDGSGYPQGLKGNEIPLIARIVAVVDTYDVMLHGRPYANAVSPERAIEELRRHAGSQFDPELVDLFVDTLAPYRVGAATTVAAVAGSVL
jgi:diguanylate cyclase (GGDEF)-like protein/PAS domain S-box-containing protein